MGRIVGEEDEDPAQSSLLDHSRNITLQTVYVGAGLSIEAMRVDVCRADLEKVSHLTLPMSSDQACAEHPALLEIDGIEHERIF